MLGNHDSRHRRATHHDTGYALLTWPCLPPSPTVIPGRKMTTAKTRAYIIVATSVGVSAAAIWSREVSQAIYYSVVTLAAGVGALILYRLSPFHPLYNFPGPILLRVSEIPMLYYALKGTRHVFVKRLHDQYGRVVQTGPNTLSFLSLSAITRIYGSSNALDKTTAYDVHSMNEEGLFFIKDKATHARRRRIWNRAFSEEALSQYHGPLVTEIQNLIRTLLQRTRDHGDVDLVRIFPQYTYDTTNTLFFSGNAWHPSLLDKDDREQIVDEASTFFKTSECLGHIEPLFHVVNLIPNLTNFLRLEVISREAASRRLKNGPSFKDGMSYWLEGDGVNMPLEDLGIEAESVLIGASDTVAAASTFLMCFLMAHEKWLVLLRDELDETFEEAVIHRLNSLDKLVVLNAVIQETLRLGTPMPGFPRVVPDQGILLDGKYIPSGSVVNVPIWAHHVDEEMFADATTFDPSRWIEDGKFVAKTTLLAFGAGPFNCVGSKLAYLQLRALTAMLLLNLEFIPTAGFDEVKFRDGVRNTRATSFVEPLRVRVVPRTPVVAV
ncbi:cytochrome P450 [Mycena albidolilacea]|uniref:Cytochrome P450 n=1 Tax=Mycena albidolilacea TaxID=1033008 RepID=A0AAD6Z4G4_9AGAR|nr:cytochrome P450 [Mycena albidolilacea]